MTGGATVTVIYSCRLCGIRDREVAVPERGGEDVVEWMERRLTPALYADHRAASPECQATSISEVKIPISGADRIGGAVKQ